MIGRSTSSGHGGLYTPSAKEDQRDFLRNTAERLDVLAGRVLANDAEQSWQLARDLYDVAHECRVKAGIK